MNANSSTDDILGDRAVALLSGAPYGDIDDSSFRPIGQAGSPEISCASPPGLTRSRGERLPANLDCGIASCDGCNDCTHGPTQYAEID